MKSTRKENSPIQKRHRSSSFRRRSISGESSSRLEGGRRRDKDRRDQDNGSDEEVSEKEARMKVYLPGVSSTRGTVVQVDKNFEEPRKVKGKRESKKGSFAKQFKSVKGACSNEKG